MILTARSMNPGSRKNAGRVHSEGGGQRRRGTCVPRERAKAWQPSPLRAGALTGLASGPVDAVQGAEGSERQDFRVTRSSPRGFSTRRGVQVSERICADTAVGWPARGPGGGSCRDPEGLRETRRRAGGGKRRARGLHTRAPSSAPTLRDDFAFICHVSTPTPRHPNDADSASSRGPSSH